MSNLSNSPLIDSSLTAHNWQKWKSRPTFLTSWCDCLKISRVEAVGLKKPNYTFKITIWKNWYFANNCLIKVRINTFLHIGPMWHNDYD